MAFIKIHTKCDSCGSSDGCAINEDMSTYCFACAVYTPPDLDKDYMIIDVDSIKAPDMSFLKSYADGVSVSVVDRRITKTTMERYGVVRQDEKYYFPYYDKDLQLVAAKVRGVKDKTFVASGAWSKGTLFGQNLFPSGGKYITIVEGEFDTLAAYQMTGSKWPVVSIRNGAASAVKDCRANYEYLNSFENIVICFDGDEVGRKAAKDAAEVFGSKCKIFKPDSNYKDACDWLADSKESQFVSRWWSSEPFTLDGLINGESLWDEIKKPRQKPDAHWPYAALDDMLCGLRKRELVTVAAGTGQGKSTFLRQIIHHLLVTTEDKIGCAFLEESPARTAQGIMSIQAMKALHLPTTVYTEEELRDAFDKTMGTSRVTMFSHFGSLDIDNVIARLRWMAKGMGCSWIILDHYQMILSGMDTDERKGLDMLLTKLRTFVEETGVGLFGVSHTRRETTGKGAENGAEMTLSSLRGTAGIAQLSDAVIGLQRDQQHDDEKIRNTTCVRLLKSRFTGETGPAGFLLFDKNMQRLIEIEDPSEGQDVL
jgi:twinkle protein